MSEIEVKVEDQEEPLVISEEELSAWYEKRMGSLRQRRSQELMRVEVSIKVFNTGDETGIFTEHEGCQTDQDLFLLLPYIDEKYIELPKPILGTMMKAIKEHIDNRLSAITNIDAKRRAAFDKARKEKEGNALGLVFKGWYEDLVLSKEEAWELSNSPAAEIKD